MTRSQKWLCVLVFAAAILPACERIEERAGGKPSMAFRESVDAVPLSYGRLVAVSPAGRNPTSVALWFESDDRTLTAVRVNTSTGAISKEAIVVPRNQGE